MSTGLVGMGLASRPGRSGVGRRHFSNVCLYSEVWRRLMVELSGRAGVEVPGILELQSGLRRGAAAGGSA